MYIQHRNGIAPNIVHKFYVIIIIYFSNTCVFGTIEFVFVNGHHFWVQKFLQAPLMDHLNGYKISLPLHFHAIKIIHKMLV